MARPLSKKETILHEAAEAFSRLGYDRATLDEIARRCAVTKPAIYYHFKDKAALYEAVLCPRFDALVQKIEEATKGCSPTEGIEAYIDTFGSFILSHEETGAILAHELSQGGRTLPQSCLKNLGALISILDHFLYQGEQRGIFRNENPFLLQLMIVASLIGYQTTAPIRDKVADTLENASSRRLDPSLEDLLPSLRQTILRGIQCID